MWNRAYDLINSKTVSLKSSSQQYPFPFLHSQLQDNLRPLSSEAILVNIWRSQISVPFPHTSYELHKLSTLVRWERKVRIQIYVFVSFEITDTQRRRTSVPQRTVIMRVNNNNTKTTLHDEVIQITWTEST